MLKPVVYIAGPISKGDIAHNITQANEAYKRLAQEGFAPINPMWSCFSGQVHISATGGRPYAFATVDGLGLTHQEWLAIDVEIVSRCDALLRLPGESKGADLEVTHALTRGVPVFWCVEDLLRWARDKDTVVVS